MTHFWERGSWAYAEVIENQNRAKQRSIRVLLCLAANKELRRQLKAELRALRRERRARLRATREYLF